MSRKTAAEISLPESEAPVVKRRGRKRSITAATEQASSQSTADRHHPRKSLMITPELYARLVAVAKINRRPTKWEGTIGLERWLDAEEKRLGLTSAAVAKSEAT